MFAAKWFTGLTKDLDLQKRGAVGAPGGVPPRNGRPRQDSSTGLSSSHRIRRLDAAMKITILDGGAGSNEADGESARYAAYLEDVIARLESSGHRVRHFRLAELKLRSCTGCWSCWLKTPGRCPQKDDTATVIREYLDSDLVLFATPLRLGFLSALTKKMLDKLVTVFLPHIEIFRGEFVHAKRYDRYPALGCLLHAGEYDAQDLEITTEYFRRYAFHFQTELAIAAHTKQAPKEVLDAIDDL
jgi:multimeric flavodoxin WrbA